MSRISKDQWAMQLATVTAQRSTCCRRSVGAVLLDADGHVLSTGYNGVAAGMPHCNEPTGFNFVYANGIDKTKQLTGQATGKVDVYGNACPGATAPSGTNLDGCEAIHAEQNALLQCPDVRRIHSCYCTTTPCVTCTKLLLNTGCQAIVYRDPYPGDAAKDLWERAGRSWLAWEAPGSRAEAR